MSDKIIGVIALIAVSALLFYARKKRLLGKPIQWREGFPMSRISEFFWFAGGYSIALEFLTNKGFFLPFFLLFFTGAVISWWFDRRNYRKDIKAQFDKNVGGNRWVFQAPPPMIASNNLPAREQFRVFAIDTAEFLGFISRPQLQCLIEKHEGWGLEPNDFFIMPESIQKLEEEKALPDLIIFLRKALGDRDSMSIRWVER